MVVATLPTASSSYYGRFCIVSGTGNDKLYICVKNANGSYAWKSLTLL